MKSKLSTWLTTTVGLLTTVITLTFLANLTAYTAVQQIAALAVAQSNTKFNNVKDAAVGNGQTSGVALVTPCLWNGASCNRAAGTATGSQIVEQAQVGGAFFSIFRSNVGAASSNIAFGITSRKLMIIAPLTNTDDICIDWVGGTAACPAANVAGDTRMAPGDSLILDDFAQTSISVIANTGTQSVNITAWF